LALPTRRTGSDNGCSYLPDATLMRQLGLHLLAGCANTDQAKGKSSA